MQFPAVPIVWLSMLPLRIALAPITTMSTAAESARKLVEEKGGIAVVAGAYNTHPRNLNVAYGINQGTYNMRYGINAARAYTATVVNDQTGKAYAALMQRSNSTGANAGFISDESTYNDNGTVRTTITGTTMYANYVLHSGYCNKMGQQAWRFDHKYQHQG